MIEFSETEIIELSIQQIGNKFNKEEFQPNHLPVNFKSDELRKQLKTYFLSSFKEDELFRFTFSNDEFELNPLYNYVTSIFQKDFPFTDLSIKISQYLYDVSNHQNIKSGDLFVVYFQHILWNNKNCEAVGIFKSENKYPFITVNDKHGDIELEAVNGINVNKLDKGCLIFNEAKNEGYKISIVDKVNSNEAQFWKNSFLNVTPIKDNFQHTKAFLNITKNYISEQMDEEFEVEKTDKISLLNRSVEYFNKNESFKKEDFEQEVLQNEQVINSFRNYNATYSAANELEIVDEFDISNHAVKKQSRFFKSILKLDKNFHVYIHGDKNLIEKGSEADGRKFYKIYYEKEA